MSISDNTRAAGLGIKVKNKVLKPGADVLPRIGLVMGTALSSKATGISMAVPQLILSPEDAVDRYGAGSMLARLVAAVFRGNGYATPVYAFPEADAGGAVAALGSVAFSGTATAPGFIFLRIAAKLYKVAVASGTAAAAVATAVKAALDADPDCPVDTGVSTSTVNFTAKSKGPWGNGISVSINERPQDSEALPGGITATVTAMGSATAGSGVPTVAADLAAGLGSGDSANELGFTDVVHGYGQDTTVLDAILAYVGAGDDALGLYADTVGRPFRVLTGDTATGSSGLTALTTLGGNRKTDRASGVVAKPGSLTHPSEIAAVAIGCLARINNIRAEQSYVGVILPGVDIGNKARLAGNDWATDQTNRDTAVKAGISPCIVEDGVVKLQNVVSFYHPSTVPATSNAYAEFANISKVQNILAAKRAAYKTDDWQGITIVDDIAAVTNPTSRDKARDTGSVIDTELALIRAFEARAWIFQADYSIKALAAPGAVTVRNGGDGFKVKVPYILSGVGNIIDNEVNLDTSIAVLQ